MLDIIKENIAERPTREAKIHTTREFLQLLILKILYDKGCFKNLAFVGGTILSFLYGSRRFSENLDFSLVNREGYKFDILLGRVVYELEKTGFSLVNAENFNDFLRERLTNIDFGKVRKDVEKFIEDKNEFKLLDKNLILKLI